jgi:hypothetical protein
MGPMTESRTLVGDERGLVGKLLLISLVVLVVFAIALVDTGTIVLAHVRTTDLAKDAASAGAQRYADSGSRKQAIRAALATIENRSDDARLHSLTIGAGGAVTVVVVDRPNTLVAEHLAFLDDLTTVTATETRPPPD